ncbi:hypothetical protein L228DRAFT_284167 [Xylona heveae TC161]|uniref:SNF2 family helicase/ATPase n=1 Tax=Xylona heveae (strain CBS 132557 / TC161) TaxID=1328760 RepID=A0A165FKW5_XYLHT|nr:hypothetical protein L228DRAFT_284167 [Xylona heveae TC161]KZF21095.1 hypothetical protein L228DRAFT_284167 [Xylona heveae TC161]
MARSNDQYGLPHRPLNTLNRDRGSNDGTKTPSRLSHQQGSGYQTPSLPDRSSPWTEETRYSPQLGDSSSLFSDSIASSAVKEIPHVDLTTTPQNLPPRPKPKPVSRATSETPSVVSVDSTESFASTASDFSTLFPTGSRPGNNGMVTEREPPRPTTQAANTSSLLNNKPQLAGGKPEFGIPSPLRNSLHSKVFNQPKPFQRRPEHHRPPPSQGPKSTLPGQDPRSRISPKYAAPDGRGSESIIRPGTNRTASSKPIAPPTFASMGGEDSPFMVKDPRVKPKNIIDLTGSTDEFNPDACLYSNKFGSEDPYAYVDTAKANENIKALLEGAFEDEDDGKAANQSARRKKLNQAADSLADQLQGLSVKGQENDEPDGAEDDEENEENEATVEGLDVQLLPHQVKGVSWMKNKEIGSAKKNGILPKGGILADDMGLGKTIQSIALILSNPRPEPLPSENDKQPHKSVDKGTLVVAPLALIKQWEEEIEKRVLPSHKLRVCLHHGPQRTKYYQDLKKYDVVITTYNILVSEHGGSDGACFGVKWHRVILDEAHTIKNRNAKATQACYALRADYRWCLTGTPMQNNLEELQSLIKFLRIKPYDDLSIWKDQIQRPMKNGRGGVAIKRLQFFLMAFMKRRTKDILKQEGALNPGGKPSQKKTTKTGFKITKRQIEKVEVDFSPEERRLYDRLEERADSSLEKLLQGEKVNYASALVLLLRLRQACNHPELLGKSISKDKDALSTSNPAPAQTPRKQRTPDNQDVDDIANLLGGLSVAVKRCDICQLELKSSEVSQGSVRCAACEEDLAVHSGKKSKKLRGHLRRTTLESHNPDDSPLRRVNAKKQKDKAHQRRQKLQVLDSDDEEEDGDWLVPEGQRESLRLGKAGGTDDEDAEGGGDWIGSEDSSTEESGDDESDADGDSGKRRRGQLKHHQKSAQQPASDSDEGSDSDSEVSASDDEKQSSPGASAKIRSLIHILHRECDEHKFIVFSQFTSMLDVLEPFLREEGIVFTRYDGSMRNDMREMSLDRLRNDRRTRVLLCSLKCGSLGLNLTAATRVVILEPFWNPFIEEQAIDRVHRLTQTIDVIVYKITVKDTVEERILELQEKKRELANAAIEGKAVGNLDMRDIMRLFGRDAERHHVVDSKATIGTPVRVLSPTKENGRYPVPDTSTQAKRLFPAKMEKPKSMQEHSVFGRRW